MTNNTISTSESTILFNRESYTLVSNNVSAGIKRYVKMINGIPTDDYFVEFYEGNTLIKSYKSFNTLSTEEETAANAQLVQMIASKSTTQAESNSDESELMFIHINDEFRLVREEIILAEGQ